MQNHIFGIHAALAAIGKQTITKAYLLANRQDIKLQQIQTQLKQQNVKTQFVDRQQLDELVDGANHQGIVLEVLSQNKSYNEADIQNIIAANDQPKIILILDGVQDPHNLGACLRSADAFGVSMIIAPKDNAVGLTSVVHKVACGAAETVPFIAVTNLARTMRLLQEAGFWLYGLSGAASDTIFQAPLTGNIGLVMGAEGKGLRQLTEKTCDGLYHIPMQGTVESLNVSVATGIVLAEATRQRNKR